VSPWMSPERFFSRPVPRDVLHEKRFLFPVPVEVLDEVCLSLHARSQVDISERDARFLGTKQVRSPVKRNCSSFPRPG